MRAKMAVVVIAALLLGADAPRERPVDKDRNNLQGTWHSVSATRDGEKLDNTKHWRIRLVIDKDRISWQQALDEGNAASVVPFSYRLDPSKDPKTIDLTWADAMSVNKNKKLLGIYRLQGDELTICVNWRDDTRPKQFESRKKSGYTLVTLERVGK